MGTHKICFYKVDRSTGSNLTTRKLLHYVLIGVCEVIRFKTYKENIYQLNVDTVDPHYTDTPYNDKIPYNDNLNITKPSLKR